MKSRGKHDGCEQGRFVRMILPSACLLFSLFGIDRAVALDADTAAQMMRESEREQRALQAEIHRVRAENRTGVSSVVAEADEHEEHEHGGRNVPEGARMGGAVRSPEEAMRFVNSPEFAVQLEDAAKMFNDQLPALNVMMASNPVPGQAFVPLQPLSVAQIQQAVGAAVRGGGEVSIAQFKALAQWQAMMKGSMTNGMSKGGTAMSQAAPREPVVRMIDIGRRGQKGGR